MARNFARQKIYGGAKVKIKQYGDKTTVNKVVLRYPRGMKIRIKRS